MSRQGVILAVMLGAACVLSWTRLYPAAKTHARDDRSLFPRTIDTWTTIREYAATERERELLETDSILTRVYRDARGRDVTLVLVYDSSGDRKMAHPQEICLTADGLEALGKDSVELGRTGIHAERLLMERGARRVLYYYWYKAGAFQSGSYVSAQLRLAWASLCGSAGGTALVRISTAVPPADSARADEALQDFALALLPDVERHLP
jgi:EpsI family protein